jgi:hypothetical protein
MAVSISIMRERAAKFTEGSCHAISNDVAQRFVALTFTDAVTLA